MQVKMTQALRDALAEDGLDAEEFIKRFAKWRAGDEYGSYYFGKDGGYHSPKVDGVAPLRHVHLVPLTDEDKLASWNKAWGRKGRKSSDRALVYASDGLKKHLLIYILDEPTAHEIASMKTPEDRETMEGFALAAAKFIDTGEVIV